MKFYGLFAVLFVLSIGTAEAQRMFDGSGRPIGRAEGLRRMQCIVFFYYFM